MSEFKAGTRETADLWVQTGGWFLLIRFFRVRDWAGAYLGWMQVTQDATGMRVFEGQKRVLQAVVSRP